MTMIPIRLGIQQRVLPAYRVPFVDLLAGEFEKGLGVFAGSARPDENIVAGDPPQIASLYPAKNFHFLRGSLYTCWQKNFIGWLEFWQPDVLIIEANPRYPQTPRAIQWMKARNRPVIGWGLGAPPSHGYFSKWMGKKRRDLVGKLDAMITYSQQGSAEYQQLGVPVQKIFIARNAATRKPAQNPPHRPPRFNQDRAAILFVGRLQERKRVDLLLRACANLPEPIKPDLWIVGDGPDRSRLEGLGEQVYPQAVFTGNLQGEPLDQLFNQADLFVLPGTGGLAVQQAMAHALPVIVGKADGTQSDLVRPENGWVVNPVELDSLQTTIEAALLDPPKLRRMGMKSFEIVLHEVNLEEMVRSFSEAILSTLRIDR